MVLPYIDMILSWGYMCSPSWTTLPSPSPSHPPGSSQCTSPEYPVSCIQPGLAICFTYDNLHVSMPFSHPRPLPQSPKDCSIHLCLFSCLANIFNQSNFFQIFSFLTHFSCHIHEKCLLWGCFSRLTSLTLEIDASYPTLSCVESSDTPPSLHFPLSVFWIFVLLDNKIPLLTSKYMVCSFCPVFASKTSLEALGRSGADLFYRDCLGRVEKLM